MKQSESREQELEALLTRRTQELAFVQAQIGAIFESSPLAIGTASLDGTILSANASESILEKENQEVILGVVDDVTDQLAAEQALKDKDEAAAVATERNRIANELHDSVTQALYSASLIAEALPKVWQKRPEEAFGSLEELRFLSQGAQVEMRTLLQELRPGELADDKFSELLRQIRV